MADKHWSMTAAFAQIDSCKFECEAGPLANNVAYQWLKGAAKVGPELWPGQGVYFQVEADTPAGLVKAWCRRVVGYRVGPVPNLSVAFHLTTDDIEVHITMGQHSSVASAGAFSI